MHNILHDEGYRWKRIRKQPMQRNTDKTKENRIKQARWALNYIHAGKQPIYIDETGFKFIFTQLYGYAKKMKDHLDRITQETLKITVLYRLQQKIN